MNQLSILLQAQPPGGAGMSIFLMIGMFVVMYFFLIRPQAKRQKEQKKFAEAINAGDQVVTTSGIHGRISRMNEDGTIQIEVSRNTFLVMERSAVSMEMTNAFRKKTAAAASAVTPAVVTK